MLTRTIVGAFLAVILAVAFYFGDTTLIIFLCVTSLIGVMELYRVVDIHKKAIGILGYLCVIAYYLCLYLNMPNVCFLVLTVTFLLQMGAYVIGFPKVDSEGATMSFFAIMYVAVMLSFIYRIRIMEYGVYKVWLVFICSWVADTCAYFVGVLFGKHKFIPKLSPKKTIEGVIGGIAGPVIIGLIYGLVFNHFVEGADSAIVYAIACGVGGAISIFGDLTASAIKRNHNIKDYGNLLPGHGGVMDRFDSMIFTAPSVYVALILLNNIF